MILNAYAPDTTELQKYEVKTNRTAKKNKWISNHWDISALLPQQLMEQVGRKSVSLQKTWTTLLD